MQSYNLKSKVIKYLLFFLTLSFSFLVFNLKPTHAQQFTLSLSPPLLEVIIKPGKSILIAYTLENLGDPTYLTAKVVSFEPQDNLGSVRLKEKADGPVRFSLDNSQIDLNQPFFLKTRQKEQLLLRIKAIDGASEGDYYYTFLVSSQPREIREGESIGAARATVGANILITITESGKIQNKGKVALFQVLPRWRLNLGKKSLNFFDSNDKIPLIFVIENKGKNLIKPQGEIILTGISGTKAKYEILPQNILAESQRLITATPSAEIETKKPTSLILSGFFLGPYQLSTNVNFGPGTINLSARTSFIALPFKFILGLIITLIIIGWVVTKNRLSERS